jgi:hypothetical protein
MSLSLLAGELVVAESDVAWWQLSLQQQLDRVLLLLPPCIQRWLLLLLLLMSLHASF